MEQSEKKKKKKVYTKQMAALVVVGMLVLLCFFNLFLGDKKVSKPKMTVNTLLNGKYMEDYEQYFGERIVGKKMFKSMDRSVQTLLGKKVSNGVYKGKNHYLAEEIAVFDEKAVKKNIQAIQEFGSTHYNVPVYVMLVPNKANIQSDRLPASMVTEDQEKQFAKVKEQFGGAVNWIDVQKVLKEHKDEEIYYHTDEHWTSLGAHYGYETLASAMGLDTSAGQEMKSYVVNNDFNGSLSQKSGYEKGYEESINIYVPKKIKGSTKFIMTNGDTGKKSTTFYDASKLETKDKYSLFLGGDFGMIDIKTTAETTDRLLLVKDSYANCLIPFLTPYYREIVVVDSSCYEGKVQEIMQNTKFTSILFLYSGNSFVTDTNLYKLLDSSVPDNLTDTQKSGEKNETSDIQEKEEKTETSDTQEKEEKTETSDTQEGTGTENETE